MTHESGPGGPTQPDAAPPPTPSAPPLEQTDPSLPEADGSSPQTDGPAPADQTVPLPVAEPPMSADTAPDFDDNDGHGGAHRAQSAWNRYRARRTEKTQEKAEKPHKKAPWWELPALVVLAIGIAILVKTFVVQPFYIPSASMELTLHGSPEHGHDRILVNKLIYHFRDPHPGDIVVFHAPSGWDEEPGTKPPGNPVLRVIRGFGQLIGFVPPDGQVLVKRVIAVGGETVWGVNVNGRSQVHIQEPNGDVHVLHEPYVWNPEPDPKAAFGRVRVPDGRLWVMGDHRSDSSDSRFHCAPSGADAGNGTKCDPVESTVPVSDVIGKAFVVAWPPSHWRTLGTPETFKSAALAGASDVPGLTAAAVVLPLYVRRRRRR
ncbi:MAG TPA: signal peptidase I [Jatrophihabitans sp.]|jgi:signal peptidase I|nr:signal peptidase I [Jatrophihabitans sp.]